MISIYLLIIYYSEEKGCRNGTKLPEAAAEWLHIRGYVEEHKTVSRKRESAGKMAAAILELKGDYSQKSTSSSASTVVEVDAETKSKKAKQCRKKKSPQK
jgi:hypothetical protein